MKKMSQLAIQLFTQICHSFEVVFVKYAKRMWKPHAPGGTIIFNIKLSEEEVKVTIVCCLSSLLTLFF